MTHDVPELPALIKSEASRVTQLFVHAVVAMVGGALIWLSPAKPSAFRIVDGLPGWPIAYGTVLTVLGATALVMMTTSRDKHLCYVLAGMALWYLSYFTLFLANVIAWLLVYDKDKMYAPATGPLAFYLGFFSFLVLHILTIRDSRR